MNRFTRCFLLLNIAASLLAFSFFRQGSSPEVSPFAPTWAEVPPLTPTGEVMELISASTRSASTLPQPVPMGKTEGSLPACSDTHGLIVSLLWGMVQELNVTYATHANISSIVAEIDSVSGRNCFEVSARSVLKVFFFQAAEGSVRWLRLQAALHAAASRLAVNVDGERLPIESHPQSCLVMMALASLSGSLQHPGTAAIEQGTFMGYSTKCIAAGVNINNRMRFYAFDTFNYMPTAKPIWANSDMGKKTKWLKSRANYMVQVQRNMLPWRAQLIPGLIGNGLGQKGAARDYDDKDVAFFAMDASKDLPFFVSALRLVSVRFLPNSVMVLGDSLMSVAMCGQVGSVLDALVSHGKVSLLWYSRYTSHTIWLVNEPFELKSSRAARSLGKGAVDRFMAESTAITRELYGLDIHSVSDDDRLKKLLRQLNGCNIQVALA